MRKASRWTNVGLGLATAATTVLVALPSFAQAPPADPGGWGSPQPLPPSSAPQPPAPPPSGFEPGRSAPPPGPPGYAPPPPAPYYAPAPYYGPGYGPPPGYGPRPAPGYYQGGYIGRPVWEYRSVGAMAGGIVGVSAGAIFLGAALVVAANNDSCDIGNCTSNPGLEAGLTIAGIVGIAVGIPLIIYGARRVPVGAPIAGGTMPSPLPQWAGAPAGRGWKWEF